VHKATFNELQALTTPLITQAEALAALVARLKLDAAGEPGEPEVTAQLDRVLELIGATDLCTNLDERERTTVIGHVTTMLRQAMDLIDDPVRPGGWYYTDPQIIQGQGASSGVGAQLIAGAGTSMAPLGAFRMDLGRPAREEPSEVTRWSGRCSSASREASRSFKHQVLL
jgi:hypothetical protein